MAGRFSRRHFLRSTAVAGVGLAALLAGCQPSQPPADSGDATAPDTGGAPPAAPTGGELRIALINDAAVLGVLDLLLEGHKERYPEVEAVIEFQVGDYTERMYTQAAAGTLPDVVWTGDSFTPPFAENGVTLDLNPLADVDPEFDRDNIFDVMLGLGEYEGGLHFLPASLDVVTMYYNKTLFEEAGAEAPQDTWTWDDYIYNGKLISDIERSADDTPQYWTLDNRTWNWWATVYPWIAGYGADIVSEDGTRSTWSSPEALEAISAYTALWTEHNIAQPLGLDVGGEAFALGRAATFLHIPGLRQHHRDAIEDRFEWDVQLLPLMPDGRHRTGMGTWGLGIYARSEKQNIAWDFIKYMLSEETQLTLAKNMANIPLLRSLADDPRWLDELDPPPANSTAFVKGADDAVLPLTSWPLDCGGFYFGEVNQTYTNALENIIRGEMSVEQALTEADEVIQRCLDAAFS